MTAAADNDNPVEVAFFTAEAVGLVSGPPVIDRALDGQEVLLRGPLMSGVEDTPAVQRACDEKLMVIRLSARQLLTVAQGIAVDVAPGWTVRGGAARVRLATPVEALEFNRRARISLFGDPETWDEDTMPPPLTPERAAELVAPIEIDEEHVRRLVARFDPFHLDTSAGHHNPNHCQQPAITLQPGETLMPDSVGTPDRDSHANVTRAALAALIENHGQCYADAIDDAAGLRFALNASTPMLDLNAPDQLAHRAQLLWQLHGKLSTAAILLATLGQSATAAAELAELHAISLATAMEQDAKDQYEQG